jgi:hypothetical protein
VADSITQIVWEYMATHFTSKRTDLGGRALRCCGSANRATATIASIIQRNARLRLQSTALTVTRVILEEARTQ